MNKIILSMLLIILTIFGIINIARIVNGFYNKQFLDTQIDLKNMKVYFKNIDDPKREEENFIFYPPTILNPKNHTIHINGNLVKTGYQTKWNDKIEIIWT